MEKNQLVFEMEELTGFVDSGSFQFLDVNNADLHIDSFVPLPQVSFDIPLMDMECDEGISLDFSSDDSHDQNQRILESDLMEKGEDFDWTLSRDEDDHDDDDDPNSTQFKENENRQLTFEEKPPVKMKEKEFRWAFPWEDDKDNPPVVKAAEGGPRRMRKSALCELCGKMLVDRHNLKRHQDNIHLGLKPFKCDLCGKGCFSRVAMKRHTTAHSGEKSFPCEICDKRFGEKHYLKTHVNRHIALYYRYRHRNQMRGLGRDLSCQQFKG